MKALGYAAMSPGAALAPFSFERRKLRDNDIAIEILFCGVCHSDLHMARGEWPIAVFPCVPGHEIVGRIIAVGAAVGDHAAGEIVGVGCMIDSCRQCSPCRRGDEHFCVEEFTSTYNSPDRVTRENTLGGYSDVIVLDADFVLPIHHHESQLAGVAPLLCAGITTWSPLRRWNVGLGSHVGIVGLGGLGHMGVKLAKAMGARVTVFTTLQSKRAAALALGADEVVVHSDKAAMAHCAADIDVILDTVAAPHDLAPFLRLLAIDGAMVMVGLPGEPISEVSVYDLIFQRRSLAGSHIGSLKETRDMLAFCAEHSIVADVEMISIADIETAFSRMAHGDVRYRFVIDMTSLKQSG